MNSKKNHNHNHHHNYHDALHLLQSYNVENELSCVHDEIHNMNQEIIEINYDRHEIVSILQEQQERERQLKPTGDDRPDYTQQHWDIHSQLLVRSSTSTSLTPEQRRIWQQERGCHFAVDLSSSSPNRYHSITYHHHHHNNNMNNNSAAVMESLWSKCGGTNHSMSNNFQDSILGTNSFLSHIMSLGNSPPKQNDSNGTITNNFQSFSNHGDDGNHNDYHQNNNNSIVHITTQTCREGGAGTTIQHLSLFPMYHGNDGEDNDDNITNGNGTNTSQPAALKPSINSTPGLLSASTPSFILSRDNGVTYHYGSLPPQLRRRIVQEQTRKNNVKSNNISPTYYMDNIIYLATGQYGTYYVEFRNSEKWWGIITNASADGRTSNTKHRIEADDEEEFNTICYDWDVHRVAFGPCHIIRTATTQPSSETVVPSISLSWIIISKDGKVAWKNIPLRLHHCLSNRIASDSTPCEVSLGAHGSYFIRFIDGTCDWVLPAKTAQECQNLIRQGKTIRSISLHPDLSNNFIIRYSM
jgi:hypothetical protein